MKIKIDPNLCIGCGACVVFANEFFDLDQEKGIAKVAKQPKEKNQLVIRAAESCPVSAIKILNKNNNGKNQ